MPAFENPFFIDLHCHFFAYQPTYTASSQELSGRALRLAASFLKATVPGCHGSLLALALLKAVYETRRGLCGVCPPVITQGAKAEVGSLVDESSVLDSHGQVPC